MDASSLRRLKDLEEENQLLKRMFADLSLELQALKDIVQKKSLMRAGVWRDMPCNSID
jgi:putative transposase